MGFRCQADVGVEGVTVDTFRVRASGAACHVPSVCGFVLAVHCLVVAPCMCVVCALLLCAV